MKAIWKDFSLGISGFSKAHKLVKNHKIFWIYLLVPIVLNILMFVIITIAGFSFANSLTDWFFGLTGLEHKDLGSIVFLEDVWGYLLAILVNLTVLLFAIIIKVTIVLIYMLSYKYIILILLAPLLALVSEKVEELTIGNQYPFKFSQFVSDVVRGVFLAIKNGFIEVLFTILFIALGFIPIIGFLGPILIFMVSSYYYGFSMIDYYNERKRLPVKESSRFVWSHKGLALSNGMLFNVLVFGSAFIFSILPFILSVIIQYILMVPIIFLSIASVYSCIAATLSGLEIDEKLSKQALYANK